MHHRLSFAVALTLAACAAGFAGDRYNLLSGVDAQHYPGTTRFIPGTSPLQPINDGQRLAGTPDVGPVVVYQGNGTPLHQPNYLGSLSMLWRRGTIPFAGGVPILGIEFLGGPLLDLDGDLNNGQRSLTPTIGVPPVEIPGSASHFEFTTNLAGGVITLVDVDITGTNEGGPGQSPDIATVLITIAGTQPDASKQPGPNPSIDTRVGTLTRFGGAGGGLVGVYRVQNLGFEIWEDAIDPFGGSPELLGSMQFLGTLNGWLVLRDPVTRQFPTLAGQGLGSTGWPAFANSAVGLTVNTANGLAGGTALIRVGSTGQPYNNPGNGGLPLTAFGSDLGAYLDAVVVPRVAVDQDRFVYLESAGFGANNSADPVFTDTIGYDATIIAAASVCGTRRAGDSNCDGLVDFADIDTFVAALSGEASWNATGPHPGCTYLCANDMNADGVVDFADIDPFVAALSTP